MKITISLLCCLLTSFPAFSWNGRGHMIIAAIAYHELTIDQRQSITEILITHPEYNHKWKADYEGVKDNVELGLYLLMRASIWADDIRSNNTLIIV